MLKVQAISFSYLKTSTLKTINFTLEKGKTLAIIGESGCGKSTLLKVIYGLYDLDKGHIFWNDTEVLGPKYNLVPGMEKMKYLAQDFGLMPYISVSENIGKFLSNVVSEKKQQRIEALLEVVEMCDFGDVKAKYLSGGQLQRVALAKALAMKPEVLLLDEPFSQIDNFRKSSLRQRLFDFVKLHEITTLIATHDSTDILSYANEIIVMKEGELIEHGSTQLIYNYPKNKYIASLFDDVNEIESKYFDGQYDADTILLYSHQIKVTSISKLKVRVLRSYFRGAYFLIECSYKQGFLAFQHPTEIQIGSTVYLKKLTEL